MNTPKPTKLFKLISDFRKISEKISTQKSSTFIYTTKVQSVSEIITKNVTYTKIKTSIVNI